MKKYIFESLKVWFVLTFLTGIMYPIIVWQIDNIFFYEQSQGNLVYSSDGKLIGAKNIGQEFLKEYYFHSRPSAISYHGESSGTTNFGPLHPNLKSEVLKRIDFYHQDVSKIPPELLLASGSGLDPHLHPQSIVFQIPRIAKSRHFRESDLIRLNDLIEQVIEDPTLSILGESRINVLLLNLQLDSLWGRPTLDK